MNEEQKPLQVAPATPFRGKGLFQRCQPWRAKRRLVVPSSREAALLTRRAPSARGEAKYIAMDGE